MMELKLTRPELEQLHQGLRHMIHDWGPHIDQPPQVLEDLKVLAMRLHSFKGDYDTEVKLGIETPHQPK